MRPERSSRLSWRGQRDELDGVQQASRLNGARTPVVLALLLAIAVLALPAMALGAPIRLGAFIQPPGQAAAPENGAALDSYAAMVGRKPDIVLNYKNLTEPLMSSLDIANLEARKETPMITWELFQSTADTSTIPLQSIAAGSYDSYLRSAADLARGLPFEIMIRFAHEMNGTWYGWGGQPTAYVEAWRHVVTVFREQGASNVKWVWAPNVDHGEMPFGQYFPGESWVDYVALDGYNFGTTGLGDDRWDSLYLVFASSYAEITTLSSKPLIISETATGEAGGNKAEWIRTGFLSTIPANFPHVAAVIWFDSDKEENWQLNSSAASLAAYQEVVRSPLFGGSTAATPPASTPPVSTAPAPKSRGRRARAAAAAARQAKRRGYSLCTRVCVVRSLQCRKYALRSRRARSLSPAARRERLCRVSRAAVHRRNHPPHVRSHHR
jgi:beta-mannanase